MTSAEGLNTPDDRTIEGHALAAGLFTDALGRPVSAPLPPRPVVVGTGMLEQVARADEATPAAAPDSGEEER